MLLEIILNSTLILSEIMKKKNRKKRRAIQIKDQLKRREQNRAYNNIITDCHHFPSEVKTYCFVQHLILRMLRGIILHCVPLTISYHLNFLRFFKAWSIHHGSVGRVRLSFCQFFVIFHQKIVLYHFHFFLDEISNFRDRIFTSQKHELVIRNFQWNYMLTIALVSVA